MSGLRARFMRSPGRMNANRWRSLFQMSWLIIIVPVYFMYRQLHPDPPVDGNIRIPERAIGPWRVELIEPRPPADGADDDTRVRHYRLRICETCAQTLRAAYLSMSRPQAPDYGVIFNGGPRWFHCRLPLPAALTGDEKVWLTLEGWNGDIHQVNVPLNTI